MSPDARLAQLAVDRGLIAADRLGDERRGVALRLLQAGVPARELATILREMRDAGEGVETIGRWFVLGELGRGASSVVHRALHDTLGTQAAIKALSERGSGIALMRERFSREAQIAARLKHPNIVPVHDFGEQDGAPFIVMDLVEGETFDDWSARPGRPLRAKVAVLETVARALAYAHAQGVVHRDLKPANILMDASDVPHLTDFGLARDAETLATLTRSGVIVGTPAYMAPEQVRGDRKALDARTDVYALGAMLYECVAGRLPFAGATPAEMYDKVLREDPLPPSLHGAGLPPELDLVCLKAMDKDPAGRFATALELADDLSRWLGGQPVAARRPPALTRIGRAVRRQAALTTVVIVAAILVAAAAVVVAHFRGEALARQRALDSVSAYTELEPRLENLVARAELARYRARDAGPPDADAILAEADERIRRVEERYPGTGVPAGYRALFHALLRRRDAAPRFDEAIAAHPDDPFPIALRARLNLRLCLETSVPSSFEVAPYAKRVLLQRDDPSRAAAAVAAVAADVRRLDGHPLWRKIPALDWMQAQADGLQALCERRYDDAVKLLENLPEESAREVETKLALGLALLWSQRFTRAAQVLAALSDRRPSLLIARYWAGMALLFDAVPDTQEAPDPRPGLERGIAQLDRVIEAAPERVEPRNHRGRARCVIADESERFGADPRPHYERAAADLDAAGERIEAANARWRLVRVRLLAGEDAWAEADALIRSLDAPPADAGARTHALVRRSEARNRLSELLLDHRRDARRTCLDAVADYDELLRLDPEPTHVYHRAIVLKRLGEISQGPEAVDWFEKSRRECEQAIARAPSMFHADVLRIQVLARLSERVPEPRPLFEEAAALADALVAKNPKSDICVGARGNLLLRWSCWERDDGRAAEICRRALADYQALARLSPGLITGWQNTVQARIRLAEVLPTPSEKRDELAHAVEDAGKAIEVSPKRPGLREARAKALFRLATFGGTPAMPPNECYRRAIEDATEDLRLGGDSYDAYSYRAQSKRNLGDFGGAIEDARGALRVRPDHGPMLRLIDDCERQLKRKQP